MLQLTYDLGTYLNVEFSALSIADVKKGVSILKNKVDLEKAMKVNYENKFSGFNINTYDKKHSYLIIEL